MNAIKEVIAEAITDSANYSKPYDRAVRVVVALDNAGYRIVRKPRANWRNRPNREVKLPQP